MLITMETNQYYEEFIPRNYQVILYEKVLNQNAILYLPTGSGKTYIAILLIKHFTNNLLKPFRNGGKRGFFIVNTVELARQQARSIQRHVPLQVKVFTGDMNLDNWTEETWHDHFKKYNIIVMTCQIFLNLFVQGYLNASDIELIIFDECHSAVDNQPMREVMQYITNQRFMGKPRILGLSATILNGNIKNTQLYNTVQNLESTFTAQIISVKHSEDVLRYSTKATEKIIAYPSYLYDYDPFILSNLENTHIASKKIKRLIKEVINHIQMLGLYAGFQACLGQIICTERLKYLCKSEQDLSDCNLALTRFLFIRKYLEQKMESNSLFAQITNFSSPKVLKLIEILKVELNDNNNLSSIIFVKERFTALSLYRLLKIFKEVEPALKNLQPDYIVGFANNRIMETRESHLFRQWNKEALEKFVNRETNVLVSSSVLEEGVDVRSCNLVIMFDKPSDYRQYVQCKGRARDASSKFFLFVEDNIKKGEFEQKVNSYHQLQQDLNNILIGRLEQEAPDRSESSEIFYPTGKGGAFVTPNTAIPIINKYCGVKSISKYSNISPLCEIIEKDEQYYCKLTLPKTCLYNEPISGPLEPTKKMAKKMASYLLVKKLYELKELDDNLNPFKYKPNLDCSNLFIHWKNEEIEKGKSPPGTNSYRRRFPQVCPLPFQMCNVNIGNVYLHTLEIRPAMKEMRHPIYEKLLNESMDLGILSSKPLPKLTPIPLYLPSGLTMLKIFSSQVSVNAIQLDHAKNFHRNLFSKILPLLKKYCIFENYSDWNGFLIVACENSKVRWDIVSQHQSLTTFKRPSPQECENAMLSPTYGHRQSDIFIGLRVENDLNTNSPFPEGPYETYKKYFLEHYGAECCRTNENLILVQPLSRNLNHINSKTARHKENSGLSTKKRVIHYVPELCLRYSIPPWLWLKTTTLPTALHRIHCLLLAEELRYKISTIKNPFTNLEFPLPLYIPAEPEINELEQDRLNLQKIESGAILEIIKTRHKNGLSKIDSESEEIYPIDIFRNFESVTPLEVMLYNNYVQKPVIVKNENKKLPLLNLNLPEINWFSLNNQSPGPNHQEVLQALTASSANDIFDSERLETLGDSILKFCASFLLFKEFPQTSEGHLTMMKGQLVGNRNLFYCSEFRNLPAIINTNSYQPELWIPPGQGVPENVREVIANVNLNPKILEELEIPTNEQISGILSENTINKFETIMLDYAEEDDQMNKYSATHLEPYLRLFTISDKAVSDACEALIGLYTTHWGLNGALRVLSWFEIFPTYSDIFDNFNGSPYIRDGSEENINLLLPWLSQLEKKIGYTFKNKGWVLQAFTHDSSNRNNLTISLERLEFLGDALIDALITSYIYQYCKDLDPGEITDLRSALVNNLTFAAISIRNHFHRYLIYDSHDLNRVIDKFAEFQEKRNHMVDDQILIMMVENEYIDNPSELLSSSESDEEYDTDIKLMIDKQKLHSSIGIAMDVPKVLGDILESLIGAIYLDSNLNLYQVWQCLYKLMGNEIREFSKKVPKQPIRRLYEMNNKIKFMKPEISEEMAEMVKIKLICEDKIYIGLGKNKSQAKRAASKLALRDLLGC